MSFRGELEIVWCTDAGLCRQQNEDSVDGDAALGIAVLADGMGGYAGGEVASEIAVAEIMRYVRQEQAMLNKPPAFPPSRWRQATLLLRDAVYQANHAIYTYAEEHPESYYGMGTTVVATLFHDKWLSIAHVGDSRLYRFRKGELTLLTKDHSVLQTLLDYQLCTVEEGYSYPTRKLITRALGVQIDIEVELQETLVQEADLYLLCSDGLSDMLEDKQLTAIFQQSQENLQNTAVALIHAANAQGGLDNISVALIHIGKMFSPAFAWGRRFQHWLKPFKH